MKKQKKKTELTEEEKKVIKDSREAGMMSEEEWALVQGMTYSELRRSSNIGSFLDDAEKNYKD